VGSASSVGDDSDPTLDRKDDACDQPLRSRGPLRLRLLANDIEFGSHGWVVQPSVSQFEPLAVSQFKFDPQPSRKPAGCRQFFRAAENIFFLIALFQSCKQIAALPNPGFRVCRAVDTPPLANKQTENLGINISPNDYFMGKLQIKFDYGFSAINSDRRPLLPGMASAGPRRASQLRPPILAGPLRRAPGGGRPQATLRVTGNCGTSGTAAPSWPRE
jgi:hypothetical protein